MPWLLLAALLLALADTLIGLQLRGCCCGAAPAAAAALGWLLLVSAPIGRRRGRGDHRRHGGDPAGVRADRPE